MKLLELRKVFRSSHFSAGDRFHRSSIFKILCECVIVKIDKQNVSFFRFSLRVHVCASNILILWGFESLSVRPLCRHSYIHFFFDTNPLTWSKQCVHPFGSGSPMVTCDINPTLKTGVYFSHYWLAQIYVCLYG